MRKINFGKFMDAKYPDDWDADAWLYVLRNGREILYVGISHDNIWNRWFGSSGRSHIITNIYGEQGGISSVGKYVMENMPTSREWIIEFWTTDDLYKYFKPEFHNAWQEAHFEKMMIRRRCPRFNVMLSNY
jgi:hypothetical protein